ncbi:hypothetical protein ACGFJ7_14185 [Actinoplanes sp. NPDC048988]|uniref:hypothetical protein n=1 Tax=Actinoplanes sp. NPDC048988 TaxID=3363901 RepID=UPI0037187C20
MTTHRVVAVREDGHWLADEPPVRAKNLARLETLIRAALGDATGEIEWEIRTGDDALDRETAELRAERRRILAEERELMARTERLVRERVSDWTTRDLAKLIGMSPQRISQISPR